MKRRVLLLALFLLSGCCRALSAPDVIFTDDPLHPIFKFKPNSYAFSIAVKHVDDRDKKDIVWELFQATPGKTPRVTEIKYGIAPDGMRSHGNAIDLEINKRYIIEIFLGDCYGSTKFKIVKEGNELKVVGW